MNTCKIGFEYPGKKCTALDTARIENELGKKLPQTYRDVLECCGGGILSPKNSFINLPLDDRSEDYELSIDQILGNGKTSSGDNNYLLTYGRFLTEEYEIPDEVLLCAFSEAGMHEYLVINYGLKDFPEGSVLYCNDEENPGEYIQVASTFAEFLELLEPDPEFSESTVESDPKYIHARSMNGALTPEFERAIAATPTPDLEYEIRCAAERTGLYPAGRSQETWYFFDLVYWAIQHVKPYREIGQLTNIDSPESMRIMLRDSFIIPEFRSSGFMSIQDTFELWWEDRVKENRLVQHEDGYRLDSSYMDTVPKK
ncbi:MAG: SMI1/KNR4 family protein [Mixta calida]|nr:SMI1/KNR4 family protein [Mixta calida]